MTILLNWNLKKFFNGKSTSKELEKEENNFRKDLSLLGNGKDFIKEILLWQDLQSRIRQMDAFIICLLAQNVADEKAIFHTSIVRSLFAELENAEISFLEKLVKLKESEFQSILSNPKIKEFAYQLKKKRDFYKKKCSPEVEKVISKLAIDGYHGWHEIYSRFIGEMKIPYKNKQFSCGQADNFLQDKSRVVRKGFLQTWNKICKKDAFFFAEALNHMAGFRLELYKNRKWSSHLFEPLFHNNMDEKSLQTMWKVIEDNKKPLVDFLKVKAKNLKLEKLEWCDLNAPFVSFSDQISYKDASKVCMKAFQNISPKMAKFAKHAFTKGWIEAEDRTGKAAGGFCIPYPLHKESRIFMTYGGVHDNLITLAHELGHAYHNDVVFHLDEFSQNFPMSLAEMASTVSERIVLNELSKEAKTKKEKASLLHNKIQRSILYFCNIRSRFLFEDAFYAKRKAGPVTSDEISKTMMEAQKKAFFSSLSEYHPQFWMTKQHFYFSHLPFYNFPYTVGYMFSLRVYAEVKNKRDKFTAWYDELLADTGRMSLEDIAKKHFKEDLHMSTFWQKAMDEAISDINEFLEVLS